MKKMKKVLLLVLCAALLVGATIAGTVAYLTSQAEVKNTFTVGHVAITMDEFDYDDSTANADRDIANEYKLIPGQTYIKDPLIHVGAQSENCYLFIQVVNEISAIEAEKTIATQLAENGWVQIGTSNVYYYNQICGKDMHIPTFTQFKVKDDVEDLSAYANKTVIVTAYAVQSETFGSAEAAWNATFGAPTNG